MDRSLNFFKEYVSEFDENDSRIKMKINHTYRTVSFAGLLAQKLRLSEREINRVETAALLHDIGRFEQIKEYDTFNDNKSLDHGDLGEEILRKNGYDDEILLTAVKYHNKYSLPNNLSKEEELYTKIVRDADKIDNLNMTYSGASNFIRISNEILEYFNSHNLISNKIIKNDFEEQLCILSYIFDINFEESFEIIDNLNVVKNMIQSLYYQSHDDKLFDIENILKSYIKERIKRKGKVKKNVRKKIRS